MKKLLVFCFLLSGCATNVVPMPMSGSKADGTVTLSYGYGMLESPVVDWSAANNTARLKCSAWGYESASPFGGEEKKCVAVNGYGNCIQWTVNIMYQCS